MAGNPVRQQKEDFDPAGTIHMASIPGALKSQAATIHGFPNETHIFILGYLSLLLILFHILYNSFAMLFPV
jgi:hypothetical protein